MYYCIAAVHHQHRAIEYCECVNNTVNGEG